MKKLCLILLALCMPISAKASCGTSLPYSLNSWRDVVMALKSNGIDAGRLNWSSIDQLCLIYRNNKSPNAYNNCRYSKARESVLFTSDRNQCREQIIGDLPDSLVKRRNVESIRESDTTGLVRQYDRVVKPYTRAELTAARASAMVTCMQSLGWQNSNDWTLGKRCE